MPRLQIQNPRERALVGAADRALAALAVVRSPWRRRRPPAEPRRILLLRLERIGDLLMALPAIADVRALAPAAEIHLAVGSWNRSLAGAIRGVDRVLVADASWLARERAGDGLTELLRAARRWGRQSYDLAINFEPDIRSNLMLAATGSAWTAGFESGGGGPLLDVALDYDVRAHTSDNTRRLVATTFGRAAEASPRAGLTIGEESTRDAARRLAAAGARPLVGVHVSGGRAIKQWDPARFVEVAARISDERGAAIVLTGSPTDRPLVDDVRRALGPRPVVDVAGDIDLLSLAAVLERLNLLVTGDTGPMHLAAAVGTPVVAVFGPSDPARYAPRGPLDRVVRVDLPCSPCNRIRQPPARCVGHIPDCLTLVSTAAVLQAALDVLDAVSSGRRTARNAGA